MSLRQRAEARTSESTDMMKPALTPAQRNSTVAHSLYQVRTLNSLAPRITRCHTKDSLPEAKVVTVVSRKEKVDGQSHLTGAHH